MHIKTTIEEALDKLISLQETTAYCSFNIRFDNNQTQWVVNLFNANPAKVFRDKKLNKAVCNAYQYVITNRKRKTRKAQSNKFKKEFTL